MLRSQDSRRVLIGTLVALSIPALFVYLHYASSIGRVVGIFQGVVLGNIIAEMARWWISRGRK